MLLDLLHLVVLLCQFTVLTSDKPECCVMPHLLLTATLVLRLPDSPKLLSFPLGGYSGKECCYVAAMAAATPVNATASSLSATLKWPSKAPGLVLLQRSYRLILRGSQIWS